MGRVAILAGSARIDKVVLYVLFFAVLFLSTVVPVFPRNEEGTFLGAKLNYGNYYAHTTRENLRVYQEGRYRGLRSRQRRVYLNLSVPEAGLYEGKVYIVGNLDRDGRSVGLGVDKSVAVRLSYQEGGLRGEGEIYPIRTNFPFLPADGVEEGDSWSFDGMDAVYGPDGELYPAPFHCRYTYLGPGRSAERPALLIEFEYSYFDSNRFEDEAYEVRGLGSGEIALYTDRRGGFFIKEETKRHFVRPPYQVFLREEGFR
ncbi:MAG TPA: hypothetical protein ENN41_10720, partial [Sediminispirochaeta sp.]|nr:hypothetical protein [Sediminispirochaeta sp.]